MMFGTNVFQAAVAKIAEPGGIIAVKRNKKGKLYFCFPGIHHLSQLGQTIVVKFDEFVFIDLEEFYDYPVQ